MFVCFEIFLTVKTKQKLFRPEISKNYILNTEDEIFGAEPFRSDEKKPIRINQCEGDVLRKNLNTIHFLFLFSFLCRTISNPEKKLYGGSDFLALRF